VLDLAVMPVFFPLLHQLRRWGDGAAHLILAQYSPELYHPSGQKFPRFSIASLALLRLGTQ